MVSWSCEKFGYQKEGRCKLDKRPACLNATLFVKN